MAANASACGAAEQDAADAAATPILEHTAASRRRGSARLPRWPSGAGARPAAGRMRGEAEERANRAALKARRGVLHD